VQSSASAPRAYPARIKYLVDWLLSNGAADAPVKLDTAKSAVNCKAEVCKAYPGASSKARWRRMLLDAVGEGLIKLINTDTTQKQLKAPGADKKIRLLKRGPFVYNG